MAELLKKHLQLMLITAMVTVIAACGGQPEDDLDPEDVFPPNLTVSDAAVSEGGDLVFTLNIDYTQGVDVSVDFSVVDVSTTDGVDYPSTSGTVVIPASLDILTATVTVATTQDALDEDDEQLTLELSNPVDTTIVDGSATGTIIDDDPLPSISVYNVSINENETATVEVSISAVSGRDVSVNYSTADGTAVSGSDYTPASGSLLIPAGSMSASFDVVSVDDGIPETLLETLNVNLSSPVNASAGTMAAIVEIGDDDAGALPFAYISDVTVTEPSDLVFNVTFSFPTPSLSSFDYQTFDGSATAAADYTSAGGTENIGIGISAVAITVSGLDDSVFEGTETFTLSLSNFSNLNNGDDLGVGTINDDEVMPDLVVYDVSVTEGGTLVFDVSLSGQTTAETTYNFATTAGSAGSGLDYAAISGSGTIAPLALTAQHSVITVDDSLDEDSETLTLDLASVVGANPLDNSGLGTIGDNDAPPTVNISDVSEFEGATLNFVASLTAASSKEITFVYQTYDETATGGVDYTGGSFLTTIAAGSTSVLLPVASIQELINESDETFAVSLGSLINVQAGVIGAQGTIQNDDVPPDIQILDSLVSEGDNAFVLVTLSHGSSTDIVFDYTTVDGTATAVGDYIAETATITITPGNLFHLIGIVTVEDLIEETGEVFSVSITSQTGANPLDLNANVAVTDDDVVPDIFIDDVTISEGATAILAVTLDDAPTQDVVINYQSYNGTAADPADFTAISGQMTIAIGNQTGALTVVSVDDLIVEATESFAVSLDVVSGGVANKMIGNVTIFDNDAYPDIFVSSVNAEEGNTFDFVVSLNFPAAQPVFFDYATADNTATQPGDYGAVSGSSSLDTGEIAVTFAVNTVENSVDEADRDFTFDISNVTFATVSVSSGTGNIVDDDAIINIYDASGTEGDTAQFVISLSKILSADLTFSYLSSSLTATDGVDYGALSGVGTVPAGSDQVTLSTVLTDDASFEGPETFEVSLSALSANAEAGDLLALGSITDNDSPPEVFIADTSAEEGVNLEFVVSLDQVPANEVTVNYNTANGTATSGSDYTADSGVLTFAIGVDQITLTVGGLDDAAEEGSETFDVTLTSATGGNVNDGLGVGTIVDNDTTIAIYDAAGTEGDTVDFVVSLTQAVPADVTFNFVSYSGTATDGVDYSALSGTGTVAAGSIATMLTVILTDDVDFEGSENFEVSLSSVPANATSGDLLAAGSITDNDTEPEIYVADVVTLEGSNLEFVVTLSKAPALEVTFDYATADNTANAGSDYTAASASATFAVGVQQITIVVAGQDDAVDEGQEAFDLNLSNAGNATIVDGAGVGTIEDNESTLYIYDAAANEGDTIIFKASLSRSLTIDSSFTYNTLLNGDAIVTDFTPVTATTVTFTAGLTELDLEVITTEDAIFEADETFGVTVTALSQLIAGDTGAVGTITNDDAIPTIDVHDVAVTEGGSAQVKVSLSGLTSEHVYFSYNTADNTATGGGTDYDTTSGSSSIAAGSSVRFVYVQTTDDLIYEGNEIFDFSISAITNASPGVVSGAVTIQDNEPAPKVYVSDISGNEGTTAVMTITLDYAHSLATQFNYNTTGISATDGVDFVDMSGTASLSPGQMTIQLGVVLNADSVYEFDESISFDLAGLVSLTPGQLSATVSILEASAPPNLYVYGDAQLESLQGVAVVSLSGNTTQRPVTFDYATVDGTADAATDFTGVSGTSTINAGDLVSAITVAFNSDTNFEVDEFFVVTLTNVADANSLVEYGVISIINDDPAPSIYIDDAVLAESGTNMNFLVSLDGTGTADATFAYATSASTATEGVDYTGASGIATIPSGSLTTWLSVAITDDSIDEVTEYFDVVLSSLTNANVGDIVGAGAINDDDPAPFIYIDDATALEGATLSFTVSLSLQSEQEIVFNYSTYDTGSAAAGVDYSTASGTVTLAAGVTLASVDVAALSDAAFETTETFDVSLTGLSNVQSGDVAAVGSITDNNTPPSLFILDAVVNEGDTVTLQVTLSEISGADAIFNWITMDNSALAGVDYTGVSSTATVPAGSLSTTMQVVTQDDGIYQGNLLFHVSLSGAVNAGFGDDFGNVSIIDGETAPISYFIVEGITDPTTTGTAETVTVTAIDTIGGIKDDYTGTITFSSDDGSASLPANYTFTGPGGDAGVAVFASGVTFNSIGTFYVRAEQVGASTILGQQSNIDVTNPSAPCNVSTAGFQVSSSSGSETTTSVDLVVVLSEFCGTDVTLSYNTYDGTATGGSDYNTASGVLTIPAGNTSANLNITVIDDAIVDTNSETFTVSLSNVGPQNVGLGTAVHTYTIFDDEGVPPCSASTIGFMEPSANGDESVTDPVFLVSLSQTCTTDVTVDYSFSDLSANNGSDYSGTAGTATVLNGSLTTFIPVTVFNDTLSEPPESFRVNLFNAGPNDVSVGLSARDYTIDNDDGGFPPCNTTIQFAQQNGTALESVTIVSLIVNSSTACSSYPITVDYATSNLSATAGSDYVFASGKVTFAINQTSATIAIQVTDDATAESTESFKVDLSNPSPAGAPVLGNSVYTHSILDNDGAGTIYYVRKTGSDANAGTSAGAAWLTVGHAMSQVAAGDTVFIGAGDYNESLTVQTAGTVTDPIQWIGDITGANTGDAGTISLSDSGSNLVLNVNNMGYNTFDSLYFTGATGGDCVASTAGAPQGIIFKNNTMDGCSQGVNLRNSDAMVFENNIVSNNSTAGIYLDQGAQNCVFRNNLIIDNGGIGLQLVKNNAGTVVVNNTFNNNTGDQIRIGQNGAATITNNIITNGGAGGIAKVSSGASTNDYNNVWNNTGGNYTGGFAAGTNDISSDPLFVGGGNYRVGATSPTLDSGSANASTITFSDGSSMGDRSTRSDGVKDGYTFGGDGLIVNMGYHY